MLMILSLLSVIIKLLKFRDYFVISLSHNLIINLTIFSSRNSISINLIILVIRELFICSSIIAIIFLLNSRQVSNINEIISSLFT